VMLYSLPKGSNEKRDPDIDPCISLCALGLGIAPNRRVTICFSPSRSPFDSMSAVAEMRCSNWMSAQSEGGPVLRMVTRATRPKCEKISRMTPAEGK
jgi:hypothetical protein